MQAELVDQARRGDREAFGVLAGGAVDRLYATARLILRDTELAQDATQDALIRAWRDLPSLRDVERFDAWLYRLIVRSCADVGRHRRRWRAEITVVSAEPSEPDRASELADRDQLESGLRRLTDAQQMILVLHFYVGLSSAEAADALEIPIGTVKSRLHYAIEALRAAIAADERFISRDRTGGTTGMSAKYDLERRIADYYEREATPAAPDWVLREALATIDATPQRRVLIRVPWRLPTMNIYAKLASAAAAVVVAGVIGYAVLGLGRAPDTGGTPTPSPTFTPSPSPTSPPLPPLTESYTSPIHGLWSRTPPAGRSARRPSRGRPGSHSRDPPSQTSLELLTTCFWRYFSTARRQE